MPGHRRVGGMANYSHQQAKNQKSTQDVTLGVNFAWCCDSYLQEYELLFWLWYPVLAKGEKFLPAFVHHWKVGFPLPSVSAYSSFDSDALQTPKWQKETRNTVFCLWNQNYESNIWSNSYKKISENIARRLSIQPWYLGSKVLVWGGTPQSEGLG